jgi:hypothetical protein
MKQQECRPDEETSPVSIAEKRDFAKKHKKTPKYSSWSKSNPVFRAKTSATQEHRSELIEQLTRLPGKQAG